MSGRGWQVAIGFQAALEQSAYFGARLAMTYLVLELGGDAVFIGILASCFSLAGLLVAFPVGRVVDRFGGAVVGTAGLVVLLAGAGLVLISPTLPMLIVAALVLGIGHTVTLIGQQQIVAAFTENRAGDTAFGNLLAAMSLGQLVGAPLATTLGSVFSSPGQELNSEAALLGCAGVTVLAIAAYPFLRRASATLVAAGKSRVRIRLRDAMRQPGMARALIVSGLVITAVELLASFLPMWAVERGIAPVAVGAMLSVRALVSLSTRLGMSRLVRRFGRSALLIVAISVAALSMGAQPFVSEIGAFGLMVLIGFGLGLPQPLTMAWLASLAPIGTGGLVLGARTAVNRFALVTVPIVVGASAGSLGAGAVFIATAVLLAGSAAAAGSAARTTGSGQSGSHGA